MGRLSWSGQELQEPERCGGLQGQNDVVIGGRTNLELEGNVPAITRDGGPRSAPDLRWHAHICDDGLRVRSTVDLLEPHGIQDSWVDDALGCRWIDHDKDGDCLHGVFSTAG